MVIIAWVPGIFNSEKLFSSSIFRQNFLRYTVCYLPQKHCRELNQQSFPQNKTLPFRGVSFSIIHETRIPFTFFGNFLEKFWLLSLQRAHPLSQSLMALPALPKGEPTHLKGKQQFCVNFFAPDAAKSRAAIGSPFGGAGERQRDWEGDPSKH